MVIKKNNNNNNNNNKHILAMFMRQSLLCLFCLSLKVCSSNLTMENKQFLFYFYFIIIMNFLAQVINNVCQNFGKKKNEI
jgi:hypothetical protein